MQGKINAHGIFRGTDTYAGYLQNLTIAKAKERQLRDARDVLRDTLRSGLPNIADIAIKNRLFDHRHVALGSEQASLRPRFRMQGSAAYHTLNVPAHKPPQEIDYDDGVYLPTSFLNGGRQPIVAAKGFYSAVEHVLDPICKKNRWKLDKSKSCCVRVEIAADAHVDLPLYAIPDQEFTELTKAALATQTTRQMDEGQDLDVLFSERIYTMLPSDQIMLAKRDGSWIQSDPRKIENWFLEAVEEHGQALRYLCRYFKGWRDFQWATGGITSLAIMACTVKACDELGGALPKNRDDTALLVISEHLPELLRQKIPNPVISDQRLDEWQPAQRAEYVERAQKLNRGLEAALNGSFHKQNAIKNLRELFGPFLPDEEFLLRIDDAEREVLSYVPAAVAAPKVHRSNSG